VPEFARCLEDRLRAKKRIQNPRTPPKEFSGGLRTDVRGRPSDNRKNELLNVIYDEGNFHCACRDGRSRHFRAASGPHGRSCLGLYRYLVHLIIAFLHIKIILDFLGTSMNTKIPTGHYCYGNVPAQRSGFNTIAQVSAYISSLPDDQQCSEYLRLTRPVYCPYWRPIGKGRVRCKLLGRVAVLWSRRSEHFAEIFYRKHPKARDRDTGCLIGDAVKDCDINREGEDFAFASK